MLAFVHLFGVLVEIVHRDELVGAEQHQLVVGRAEIDVNAFESTHSVSDDVTVFRGRKVGFFHILICRALALRIPFNQGDFVLVLAFLTLVHAEHPEFIEGLVVLQQRVSILDRVDH